MSDNIKRTSNNEILSRFIRIVFICLVGAFCNASSCDDPIPGQIGGFILTLRITPSEINSPKNIQDIAKISIRTRKIDIVHQSALGKDSTQITVDTHNLPIEILNNGSHEILIGQFQAPVGYISQIRIYPAQVDIILKDGTAIPLEIPSPNLPSWDQSGWKFTPANDLYWTINKDELTGIRGLLVYADSISFNKGIGYKFKPTLTAEEYPVNPTNVTPGVYVDRLLVLFKDGVSLGQVQAVNASIGAKIVNEPIPGFNNEYQIKFPPTTNIEDAVKYYKSKTEVATVTAAGIGVFHKIDTPNDLAGNSLNANMLKLPAAWKSLCQSNVLEPPNCMVDSNSSWPIGSRRVRVAVIDNGIDVARRDIYRNIAINFNAIPRTFRNKITDADQDGVIGFGDFVFGDPMHVNAAYTPKKDVNGNGYIDAIDLLNDPMWANGDSSDEDDGNQLADDLIGWNFTNNTNKPFPDDASVDGANHGTAIAGVIGAEGNNGIDCAGVAWGVSIVPIKIGTGKTYDFMASNQGIEYAVRQKYDIIAVSSGYIFYQEGTSCVGKLSSTVAFNSAAYQEEVKQRRDRFNRDPFVTAAGPVKSVFVFSAGNDQANIGDDAILSDPAETLKQLMPDRVLIVGSSTNNSTISDDSNYGSPAVDIYAPRCWTSLNLAGGTSSLFCGTSFAAPSVAGVAVLAIARDKSTIGFPERIVSKIKTSAAQTINLSKCGASENGSLFIDALSASQ